MKRKRSRIALWKKIAKWIALAFGMMVLGLAFYLWHLSAGIDKRFSGRRWSIPSKVFSDITILYPGQNTNQAHFLQKLRNFGYREISGKPQRKGEFRSSAHDIELFLHNLDVPYRKRTGFPVQIRFSPNSIESIVRLDNGESVPLLELEPEEIGLFFGPERERRQLVSIDSVPKHVIYAILAAEDSRFFEHHGVDLKGMLRALYMNLRHRAIVQGGSTITQQLAKCYFLSPERTLSRKLKEFLMSITMELMYDKREILEIYLNEIYLGQKETVAINGVGEASYFYFGKPVGDLSLPEGAIIAGLLKAPNRYSPYVDKDRCLRQRNAVLRAMHRNGWISAEELQMAQSSPIKTVGLTLHGKKAPYFLDYVSEQLKSLYSPEDLSSLGLSIHTTLNTNVQTAAEKTLESGLAQLVASKPELNRSEPEKRIQGAIIVMQPKTGYILAMVGGRDYDLSQFNRATQARRQPGSAFKPFVFLSGLDEYTPASLLSNEPKSYVVNGRAWQPQNYEPVSEGYVSMRSALAKSINLATVDLAMRVGLDRIVSTASTFHFSTPIHAYPSISLGAFEVIPIELARAYCAFAADGALPQPLSLKEVVNENGQLLERRHMIIEQVTSPAKAFIMSSMLWSVVEEGTARALKSKGISYPVAGKTGTTNDYRDAWFIGYTPDILSLVWVGFDHGDPIYSTGSSAALPIWIDLMKAIPECISGEWFKMPPGVVTRKICSDSRDLAIDEACPNVVEEFFLAENVPEEYCSLHLRKRPFRRLIDGVKDFIKKF
jgi:penicillin-binding protein 1B